MTSSCNRAVAGNATCGKELSCSNEAAEATLYEQRLSNALEQSRNDFANGRYYTSRETLMEAVKVKRKARC